MHCIRKTKIRGNVIIPPFDFTAAVNTILIRAPTVTTGGLRVSRKVWKSYPWLNNSRYTIPSIYPSPLTEPGKSRNINLATPGTKREKRYVLFVEMRIRISFPNRPVVCGVQCPVTLLF